MSHESVCESKINIITCVEITEPVCAAVLAWDDAILSVIFLIIL